MSLDILKELNVERMREVYLKYTRRAYELLPLSNKHRILDIGCGFYILQKVN